LFSIHILNALNNLLNENQIEDINVVTSASVTAKPTNNNNQTKDLDYFRGNQIIDICIKNNIKYHVWSELKQDKSYSILKGYHIGVVASFGHLIPTGLINIFPKYIFTYLRFYFK
jgi:methionyl-tRNA formyltransferase